MRLTPKWKYGLCHSKIVTFDLLHVTQLDCDLPGSHINFLNLNYNNSQSLECVYIIIYIYICIYIFN